jgi:hypothetical protein
MTLKEYRFEETFIYEVAATSVEEARKKFDEYLSSNDGFETDTKFLDNELNIYDGKGNEVRE